MKSKTDSRYIRDLAKRGVAGRLAEIESELQYLYQEFPEFFPGGLPVLTQPRRKAISDAQVQQVVAQVEARYKGQADDLITRRDAAKRFGVHLTTIHKRINRGHIQPVDENGNRGALRYRISDIQKAFQDNGTRPDHSVQEAGV